MDDRVQALLGEAVAVVLRLPVVDVPKTTLGALDRQVEDEPRWSGRMRAGLSIDDAADTIWAMNSSELFVLLTAERGWTPDRFERWLAVSWRLLLD